MSNLIRRVFRITAALFLVTCLVLLVVQVVWVTPGQDLSLIHISEPTRPY